MPPSAGESVGQENQRPLIFWVSRTFVTRAKGRAISLWYERRSVNSMAAKLNGIKAELRKRMHESAATTGKWLRSVVRGYNPIPRDTRERGENEDLPARSLRLWLRQLRRRSQRSRWRWERFLQHLGHLVPEVQTLHPYPDARFDTKHIQGRNRVR